MAGFLGLLTMAALLLGGPLIIQSAWRMCDARGPLGTCLRSAHVQAQARACLTTRLPGEDSLSWCPRTWQCMASVTEPAVCGRTIKPQTPQAHPIQAQPVKSPPPCDEPAQAGCGLRTGAVHKCAGHRLLTIPPHFRPPHSAPPVMSPPEPAVAMYATQYIGVRAFGIPAVLAGFVAIGTYRGFKVRCARCIAP